ncbi:fluoride efflux transporter FluC [Paenibacillus sp. GYB003]|uniref:fluoride efflux transporter FluC n=1 Tax=Paenibacillus sp. GYB003 TaxID=2994392 RepID=UPI002F963BDC
MRAVSVTVCVGIAGALGAISRFAVGAALEPIVGEALFPAATLLCNWSGSFALGFATAGGASRLGLSETGKTAVTSGFIGSFTTFSALSKEMTFMLQNGEAAKAFAYLALSLWGGLLLARLGGKAAETAGGGGREA